MKYLINMILDGIATFTLIPDKRNALDWYDKISAKTDEELEEIIENQKRISGGQTIGLFLLMTIFLLCYFLIDNHCPISAAIVGILPGIIILYAKTRKNRNVL